MRFPKSFLPRRIAVMTRWTFIGAVLVAFGLAVTSSLPDQDIRAEGVSQAALGQVTSPSQVVPGPSVPAAPMVASADMLGLSGRLRAVMGTQDALLENPMFKPLLSEATGPPASWPKLATPDGDSFAVVTLVPFEEAEKSGFSKYRVGSWPSASKSTASAQYAPPSGFIGVTPENQETNVSANFKMRDFLTHDQGNVWPKVLVLRPTLLDKLELIRVELEREGLPSRLHVMSGFRTPQYNKQGVGKGGRAKHSRHMYGDAADVFVDADGNGTMDDLTGDGKVTVADARVLRAAAERVEAEYPSLVGGLSAYPANSAHGPFVHVDTRGFKARW